MIVTHCMSEAFILYIFWMSKENCGINWLQTILLNITCFLSCLIYSLQDEANLSVLQSVFATNSQCINCTDISCSQVTTQLVCMCAFGRRWKRNLPETNSLLSTKTVCSFCASNRNKAALWHVLDGANLVELNQSKTHAGTMWPTCEVHVTSCLQRSVSCKGSPPCGLRAVRVTRDVTRQADCTSDAWKTAGSSTKMAKVHRALPCSPDTSTLGLSYRWTKPFQTNRRGVGWGISIVHSGCFGILLLTEPRQKDLETPACLKCVCMVNHSRPPALVSFTYFISQVCEPLHS